MGMQPAKIVIWSAKNGKYGDVSKRPKSGTENQNSARSGPKYPALPKHRN